MGKRASNGMKRRQFLELLGAFFASLSVAGLSGCGGNEEPARAAEPAPRPPPRGDATPTQKPAPAARQSTEAPPKPAPPAGQPTEAMTKPAAATGGELPRLDPDDPQARALAYTHDASTVEQAAHPRYAPGQVCRNCALFQGDATAQWAGCSIFIGRAVNAGGWCSAYVAKG